MWEFDPALDVPSPSGLKAACTRAASALGHKYRERFVGRYFSNDRLVVDSEVPEVADRVWWATPEQPVEYADPHERDVPSAFDAYTSNHTPDRRYVCKLSDCHLFGPAAAGFTADGALILATACGDETALETEWVVFLQGLSTRDLLFRTYLDTSGPGGTFPNCVFPLVPFYDRYYYHWILESLPKLRALDRYEAETGIEPAILVKADPPSFVVESLSLLGYSRDRLVEWTGDTQRVETLVVTNHRPHFHHLGGRFPHSLDDFNWLRERLTTAVDPPSGDGHRIYVSRQEAEHGRRVRNYDELLSELEPLGFRPVVMERLPFRRQVELITEAEAIVGPHGAGLVNMLFGTDPTVVELLPETDVRPHFYLLADILEFEYHCLVTDANEQDNMDVDVTALRETLAEAGLC